MVDLSWLEDDLAIGGAFPSDLALDLARDHGIAAVIDVREEACDDATVLASHGITLLHLPTADLCAVAPEMIDEGVAFAAAQRALGRRVLVHCMHGVGRSALVALCVLVDRGRSPLDALAHAKERHVRLSPSPAQFEAWVAWLAGRGIATPSLDELFAIAYRHLREP